MNFRCIKNRYKLKFNLIIYKLECNMMKKFSQYMKGVVYDLGCGERPYESFVLKNAKEYIGVDWSKTLHDLKADLFFDLNEIFPLDSNKIDTVMSISVMEHLYNPQLFLNEIYRILKPEGTLLLQVPFQWYIHEAPFDYFRYTEYGLKYLIKNAGFDDIFIEATSGFWISWILKINYIIYGVISIFPKIVRIFIHCILTPLFVLNQWIAYFLDKIYKYTPETAGYIVIAKKRI